jgi:hypothetical protein
MYRCIWMCGCICLYIYVCGCVCICLGFLLFICIKRKCVLKRIHKVVGHHMYVIVFWCVVHMTIFKIRIVWIWVSFGYLFRYLFFCVEDLVCFFGVGVNVSIYVASCGCECKCLCCFVWVFHVDIMFICFLKKFNIIQIWISN